MVCMRIYHDIDNVTKHPAFCSTSVGKRYVNGDIVTVHVDTDKKEVYFEKNDVKVVKVTESKGIIKHKGVIKYEGDYDLQPVVGFGPDKNEQHTIIKCSWWE